MIEVLTPGLMTSLQDRGRPGLAHLGIGRAGAADPPALRLATRWSAIRPMPARWRSR